MTKCLRLTINPLYAEMQKGSPEIAIKAIAWWSIYSTNYDIAFKQPKQQIRAH